VYGERPTLAGRRGLIAAETVPGRFVIHDLATQEPREELVFASPISTAAFGSDEQRLFVLTAAQKAYLIDAGRW
jgi:hypothetical protein